MWGIFTFIQHLHWSCHSTVWRLWGLRQEVTSHRRTTVPPSLTWWGCCVYCTFECQLTSTCDHVMMRRRRRKRTHLKLQTVTLLQHFKQLQVVFSRPIRERRPSVYSSAPGRPLFFFCLFVFPMACIEFTSEKIIQTTFRINESEADSEESGLK